MKIYKVQIPFTQAIDHNLKSRKFTESVVLKITTEDGVVGYGEGAPRDYVTGEQLTVIVPLFQQAVSKIPIPEINDLTDIEELIAQFYQKFHYPSLVCAFEMALLDLLGQYQNCSISDFLAPHNDRLIRYSAVLPFLPIEKMEQWLGLVKSLEINQVKLKVGKDLDLAAIKLARNILGYEVDLRVDANRAWDFEAAVKNIQQLEKWGINSVEEPLKSREITTLPKLSQFVDIPLMLDESVYNLHQAQFYARRIPSPKLLFNLKISKSGGLFATDKLHHFATQNGIVCQLGCNVGETALLSAAGRIFAQTHSLKYLEGSYAPFFMEDDLGQEPMLFSKKGMAQLIGGSGLGVVMDDLKFKKYSQQISKFQFFPAFC